MKTSLILKVFLAGVYNKEDSYIFVRILRMFSSETEVKTKEDLMTSYDLDITYDMHRKYKDLKEIRNAIREIMDIVEKSYKIGARIGLD